MCSLVMSHLDYSNSLLVGITDKTVTKMQCVQNAANQGGSRKGQNMISASRERFKLPWLPIQG